MAFEFEAKTAFANVLAVENLSGKVQSGQLRVGKLTVGKKTWRLIRLYKASLIK